MKQLSLLTIIFCLICGVSRATTVSGTVTNVTTGNPVASQKIYIEDSLKSYIDSTLTNSSGSYSFTLPGTLAMGDFVMVYTTACGAFNRNYFYYAGTSVTSNFSVCGGTYQLHGNIYLGGSLNSGPAILYLIREQYNPVLMDTTLTAIDSIAITGGYYSKAYPSIPSGTLLLKVALKPAHTSYSSFLPTYYVSSLVWSGAASLLSSNFSPSNLTNITMIGGTNPGGPGFIGGSVLLGANKNTGVGDPLSDRILILTDGAGQAVAYTYSDAAGHFSFPSLAFGTYKIFGDAWGKTNPALTLTISASQATINNVIFEENSTTFKGHIGSLGVNGGTALQGVTIYPNPAHTFIALNGLSAISGNKTVVIRDVTGSVVSSTGIAAGNTANIAIAELPAGMYMMQLQTAEGTSSYKLIKE